MRVGHDDTTQPKPSLTIGFVNENLSGHATFHQNLVRELTATDPGVEAIVYDLPPKGMLRRLLTSPYPLPEGWDFDAPIFRNQIGQSIVARQTVKHMIDRCDVLHLYTQNCAPMLAGTLRTVPYVVCADATTCQASKKMSFRYPGIGNRTGDRLARIYEERIFHEAAAVVAQSEWARRDILEVSGLSPDRVTTLRIGAPRPLPWIPRPSRERPQIVMVGASLKRKGGFTLLQLLADEIGRTCDLTLVTGVPVPPRPGLTVRNDVRPGDGKIDQILLGADVFVLPSDSDMSPNAVLEAMAAGLPVVAYDTGAISEMVEDGRTGRVVPVGDREGLHSALLELLASPDLRAEYGQAGRQRLEHHFDPAAAAAGVGRDIAAGLARERLEKGCRGRIHVESRYSASPRAEYCRGIRQPDRDEQSGVPGRWDRGGALARAARRRAAGVEGAA